MQVATVQAEEFQQQGIQSCTVPESIPSRPHRDRGSRSIHDATRSSRHPLGDARNAGPECGSASSEGGNAGTCGGTEMTAGRIQPQQPPATFLQLASGRKPGGPPGDPAGHSTWQARRVWDLPGSTTLQVIEPHKIGHRAQASQGRPDLACREEILGFGRLCDCLGHIQISDRRTGTQYSQSMIRSFRH